MTETSPPDGRVTTAQAAEQLGVPADIISLWKHRGRVTPVGYIPGPGRGGQVPLYRLEELRPLARRYLLAVARRLR